MKTAEERIEIYMGGTREEIGEQVFDEMVELLNEHALDAERSGYERGVREAAEVVEGEKAYYRFAKGVGQGNDGPHNGKLTEVKQIILSLLDKKEEDK